MQVDIILYRGKLHFDTQKMEFRFFLLKGLECFAELIYVYSTQLITKFEATVITITQTQSQYLLEYWLIFS